MIIVEISKTVLIKEVEIESNKKATFKSNVDVLNKGKDRRIEELE